MRVVVTRPLHDSNEWAAYLASRGHYAIVLPLIEIAPLQDRAALADIWNLPDAESAAGAGSHYAAAMFVSTHAVNHFFAARRGTHSRLPFARAWAPGPGTGEALRAHGIPADLIDEPDAASPQFDSEALWERVSQHVRPGDRVLFVRGGNDQGEPRGRDWIARQVEHAGGVCTDIAAYIRRRPTWTPEQIRRAADAMSDGSIWLFSSSEAIENLRELLPGQSWSHARALATHPRIAQTAKDAGFGKVRITKPQRDEVLASIESKQ